MPPSSLVSVLRHLRRTAGAAAGLDDAALLERFAAGRDEAAFELLVWRHGPMVLGVCRRRLRDIHAAEDAFQATFLALARRAKSIRRQASVAGWLYRVAGRVALAARQKSGRRIEQPLDEMTPGREPEPADSVALRELREALDHAIGRLPARYREPLVLTCFADRSHAQAARELGCAVRTIESRLGRARQKLRTILLRRGLLPAGGLAAALAPAEAPAHVATSLIVATVRAAGHGTTSVAIETLTQGVLNAMLLSKIKIAGAVMFAAGFVGLGTGGWVYQSRVVGQVPGGEPAVVAVPVIPQPDVPTPPSPPTLVKQPEPDPAPSAPVVVMPDRKQRAQSLLRELAEALKDDPPEDAMKNLEAILKAATDRRAEQERSKINAQELQVIDSAIKNLKATATGDSYQVQVVAEFEAAFGRLKERIRTPNGSTADPTPGRQIPLRLTAGGDLFIYDYTPRSLGTVGNSTIYPPSTMKTVEVRLNKANGVVPNQILEVRRDPSSDVVGYIRIVEVTGAGAVGCVEPAPGKKIEYGDNVFKVEMATK